MGSDRLNTTHREGLLSFNPRSRMGSDVLRGTQRKNLRVSTHAPAWGATVSFVNFGRAIKSFNPRSRMGSDVSCSSGLPLALKFQPTLPHGERHPGCHLSRDAEGFQPTLPHGERQNCLAYGATTRSFNPRSRMGSDALPFIKLRFVSLVSTHAPAWGATAHEY